MVKIVSKGNFSTLFSKRFKHFWIVYTSKLSKLLQLPFVDISRSSLGPRTKVYWPSTKWGVYSRLWLLSSLPIRVRSLSLSSSLFFVFPSEWFALFLSIDLPHPLSFSLSHESININRWLATMVRFDLGFGWVRQ